MAQTLLDLAKSLPSVQPSQPQDIVWRWGLQQGDPETNAILTRLSKTWRAWAPDRRERFLETAERIAAAERSKKRKRKRKGSPATRRRHMRLAKAGTDAARLVKHLATMFPPPWTGDKAAIADLIVHLSEFVGRALETPIDYEVDNHSSLDVAATSLRGLGPRRSWELLRDLAWLASGKSLPTGFSERTLRRYLQKKGRLKPASGAHWKRNWRLLKEIAPYAREAKATAHDVNSIRSSYQAAMAYLSQEA